MTQLHFAMQTLAWVLMLSAGMVAWYAKQRQRQAHFLSTHSWSGVLFSVLFTLNLISVCDRT